MFEYWWVVKFLKNYMQGKTTTQQVMEILHNEVNPLLARNSRQAQKIEEQRKVIEHLRRKIESNESD